MKIVLLLATTLGSFDPYLHPHEHWRFFQIKIGR
jgi:hypothetical protein